MNYIIIQSVCSLWHVYGYFQPMKLGIDCLTSCMGFLNRPFAVVLAPDRGSSSKRLLLLPYDVKAQVKHER